MTICFGIPSRFTISAVLCTSCCGFTDHHLYFTTSESMCGIYLNVSKSTHVGIDEKDVELLSRRGPDSTHTHKIVVHTDLNRWYLTFTSSVLSLRGNVVQTQPVIDQITGSVFCWNGEAWLLGGVRVAGNDTQAISRILFDILKTSASPSRDILDALNKIAGPYAFVLYDAVSKIVYFGRDLLGRRSLLLDDTHLEDGELTISSINTMPYAVTSREVDTESLKAIDLTRRELTWTHAGPRPRLPVINRAITSTTIPPLPADEAISELILHLRKSLEVRVIDVPTYTPTGSNANPSRVAILFSGGLDCTLLARLAHDILPHDQPIDLLNVAFENPRVINARTAKGTGATENISSNNTYESCPDRMTGRSSFSELKSTCPQRLWRFVAIDIPYREFTEHRPTIVHLMQPHNTEMDLSITSALYFAARGIGMASLSTNVQEHHQYATTARVLLSGLGADELFGGYSRHAAAFNRNGYSDLIEELSIDFARIGTRNLGRDDRVIANWGRETRYPFLDEGFVEFALGLPVWQKCGFRLGKPIAKHFESTVIAKQMEDLHPEKMLLRCAMWRLGMSGAASEKKRAIQFGARTAKMQVGSRKGTDLVTIPPITEQIQT